MAQEILLREGTVVKWKFTEEYGFARTESGQEVFFRAGDANPSEKGMRRLLREPKGGDRIQGVITPHLKGYRLTNWSYVS